MKNPFIYYVLLWRPVNVRVNVVRTQRYESQHVGSGGTSGRVPCETRGHVLRSQDVKQGKHITIKLLKNHHQIRSRI